MTFRISAPVLIAGFTALFSLTSAHAQPAQNVGADRIYAAEARAARLQAENQQLKASIATQSAALKRLDDEINLMRQEQTLQLNNQREQINALQGRLAQLQNESSARAGNEAAQAQAANQARAELARIEALLEQERGSAAVAQQRIQELQNQQKQNTNALLNAQQIQAASEQVQQKLDASAEREKSLRLELARTEAGLNQANNAYQQESKRLNDQLSFVMQRNEALQAAVSQAGSENQKKKEQTSVELNQMQAKLDALQQEYSIALDRVQSCNSGLQTAETRASSAEQQCAAASSEISAQLNQAQMALAAQQQNLAATQNSAKNCESRLQSAENQAGAFEQKCATQSGEINTQLNQVQTALAAQQQKLEAAQNSVQSCEAQLRLASAPTTPAAPDPAVSKAQNRLIGELEQALSRANSEIQSLNQKHANELQMERSMAAGTEAEMERQLKKRIDELNSSLTNCRAN